jgi:hypothetical protein
VLRVFLHTAHREVGRLTLSIASCFHCFAPGAHSAGNHSQPANHTPGEIRIPRRMEAVAEGLAWFGVEVLHLRQPDIQRRFAELLEGGA